MTAVATGPEHGAGAAAAAEGGRLRSALEAALDAALLPVRVVERVYIAGKGSLASVESYSPLKIAGAAWSAAAEGAQVRQRVHRPMQNQGKRDAAAAAVSNVAPPPRRSSARPPSLPQPLPPPPPRSSS